MKKTAPIIIMLLYASAGFAQIEKKVTYLLGVCPFDEVLRSYDTTNLSFINSASLLSNNYVITGVNGMSKHPLTDSLYVLYKESGNSSNRHLGVLNPITLKVNDKGATGDRFSGITFSDSGDLYGVTGDGANNPEELYTLDTGNATPTYIMSLGNGDDGESISWLPNSGSIYHWSGNGAPNVDQIFEKVDVQNFTTNPINVTGTGFNEEVDGSMYWGNYKFLFQNHYSEFWFVDTLGQAVNTGVTSDNDLKGLAFFDCFKIRSEANGICPNGSALLIASEGFSYQWYLNGSLLNGATNDSLYATASGVYNCIIDAGLVCGTDSVSEGIYLQMYNLPVVSLNPTDTVNLCPGDSVMITGSQGGTSQWYRNGVAINGADTNVYYATSGGWYNMTKTNQNGCTDSAATGVFIFEDTYVLDLGPDTTICDTATLDINAGQGSSYVWSTGDTSQIITVSDSGIYYIDMLDIYGCPQTDTIEVMLTPCVGLAETGTLWGILIYPNPSEGQFNIKLRHPGINISEITVTDIYGRLLYRTRDEDAFKRIDLQGFEYGVYYARLRTNNGNITYKLSLIK